MDKEKKNNIFKTALLIEGGGMRCAFSAGILNCLLEEGIYINYVIGISAGSSCLVNYLARRPDIMKKCFTDFVTDPNAMSWRSFFKGGGYMQSDYIYGQACQPGGPLHIDFDDFFANPASYRIVAYEEKQGPMFWTEKDSRDPEDLMMKVRASSSLPLFMPPTHYQGKTYYDGGINNGLPIDIAFDDGFDRILVIRTKTRTYVRPPLNPLRQSILRRNFRGNEKIQEALFSRYKNYNQSVEIIKLMEKENKALMVCPEIMEVSNHDRDLDALNKTYVHGLDVGKKEVGRIKTWLEEGEKDEK